MREAKQELKLSNFLCCFYIHIHVWKRYIFLLYHYVMDYSSLLKKRKRKKKQLVVVIPNNCSVA